MGGMANKDWTDALLDRLAATRTRKEIEAYQVTARISRIALHIARHQEEVFGRFGLNRGEVGVLGALLLAGSGQQLSPTQLSDRRGVLVNLTVAGNKVLEQAVAADAAGEQELLSALTKEDRGALVLQLKKLLTGLEPTP